MPGEASTGRARVGGDGQGLQKIVIRREVESADVVEHIEYPLDSLDNDRPTAGVGVDLYGGRDGRSNVDFLEAPAFAILVDAQALHDLLHMEDRSGHERVQRIYTAIALRICEVFKLLVGRRRPLRSYGLGEQRRHGFGVGAGGLRDAEDGATVVEHS